MNIFDSIIIGAGPAGLSAAIYLSRFNRSALVIDRGQGRTSNLEVNENYLGFPEGIAAQDLTERGREQARRYGTVFSRDSVESIVSEAETFIVAGRADSYRAKTVILATGVTDLFPNLDPYKEYLGRTLFWCITCDGYKTRNQKVLVVGDTNDAACTALQFLNFTPFVTLITNYPTGIAELSPLWRTRLQQANIPLVEAEIKHLEGRDGILTAVELDNGQYLETNFIINQQGAVPNTKLAVELGVTINSEGYIETDEEQRTNIPFVYAAGDVTRAYAHQIVTAAHEGSMAAQAANYDLYRPEQRF